MPTYDVTYHDVALGEEVTIPITCDHTAVDGTDYRFQDVDNNDVYHITPDNVVSVVQQ